MNAVLRATVVCALMGGVSLMPGLDSAAAAHGIILSAASQSQHDHGAKGPEPAPAPMQATAHQMARMATLDARIETLVADVKMFTGDMKIEAMAELLVLLVERQSMMQRHMSAMHGRMMEPMKDGTPHVHPDAASEPDEMCAPEDQR
jgi:hypothetical protein